METTEVLQRASIGVLDELKTHDIKIMQLQQLQRAQISMWSAHVNEKFL